MRGTTIAGIAALVFLLAIGLGCSALGAGVRGGQVGETLVRFPPGTRYQMIVRLGSDGRHWGGDISQRLAINIWLHGARTDWHVVRLLHIPLGERQEERRR